MDDLEQELALLVRGLRCDRCRQWPAVYDAKSDAVVCEDCAPIKRRLLALLRRSFAAAELVVEDHED